MSTSATIDPRFSELHDRAADAFGTATIFQRRARKYRRLVRTLTFFGVAIPGGIGGVVLANLFQKSVLEQFIWVAGALGALQLIFFFWSIVANWPENLDYSSAASADNFRLSNQLRALAVQAASPPTDFNARYSEAVASDESQNLLDNKRDISDTEKVYGHRAALIQFERKCNVCEVMPISMTMPTWPRNRCPRCGGPRKK